MKSLFDSYVSSILFFVIVFAITAFSVVQMQIILARRIHISAINQIQSSYYTVDVNAINDKIKTVYPEGWWIDTQIVSTVANRKDVLVTMHYKVTLPLFGLEKEGVIEGYAR